MPTNQATLPAKRLAPALRALEVQIDSAAVHVSTCDLPSYPDGPRPTSRVVLTGGNAAGEGEHVGWSRAAHQAFRARMLDAAPKGRFTIDAFSRYLRECLTDPYDRAAVEAAAIDLALRQAHTNLYALLGMAPRAARYVVSLGRFADPRPAIAHELASGAPGIKLDVDASWSDAIYRDLAATGPVRVLDFKRSGSPADHERAHSLLPEALLEDPLPSDDGRATSVWRRLSLDAPITSVRTLEELASPLPAAVNVKPARMGGVLEAIDAIAWCHAHDLEVYLGGMFEIGAGRRQLLTLAVLLCPDGPNDIAPIPKRDGPIERPALLAPGGDVPGFA